MSILTSRSDLDLGATGPVQATRSRRVPWTFVLVLGLAAALRGVFPTADPPWRTTVGVVWHDEGAWVHNARNKALFGSWRLDEWNPLFIAPVFTGARVRLVRAVRRRRAAGAPGLRGRRRALGAAARPRRQAHRRRSAPGIAGELSARDQLRLRDVRPRRDHGGAHGGASSSRPGTARRARTEPRVGRAGGTAGRRWRSSRRRRRRSISVRWVLPRCSVWWSARTRTSDRPGLDRQAAFWTLAGLAVALIVVAAAFVLPHWTDYRFYNWQMSVTRKPSYDLRVDPDARVVVSDPARHVHRACGSSSWSAPSRRVGHRRCGGVARRSPSGCCSCGSRSASLELLVHDVGNERRFVFLIPALVALTAMILGRRDGLLPDEAARIRGGACCSVSPADSVLRLRDLSGRSGGCRFSTTSGRACVCPRRSRSCLASW